jgi:hypothetical protein
VNIGAQFSVRHPAKQPVHRGKAALLGARRLDELCGTQMFVDGFLKGVALIADRRAALIGGAELPAKPEKHEAARQDEEQRQLP